MLNENKFSSFLLPINKADKFHINIIYKTNKLRRRKHINH